MVLVIKLEWREPNFIKQKKFSLASDTSTVNLYLLRKKYNIEVAELNGIMFRRYNGANINRNGYGFPLSDKNFDLNAAIAILKADSEIRGEKLRFCLCEEFQRAEIDKIISVDWQTFDGDSDYIYKREDFAKFEGKKYHQKKNLFNKFMRNYPDAKYFSLTLDKLPDALQVAEKWLTEHEDGDISLQIEFECIKEAVENWENLGMKGEILYAYDEPVAMIMFSELSEQCIDVHFEKSTNEFAQNGAPIAINKFMASSEENSAYKYINREEDMGIIGLKQSKESYNPHFKIKKFYGVVYQ